jgi:hypothetical protein
MPVHFRQPETAMNAIFPSFAAESQYLARMKMTLFALALVLCGASQAWASLGETETDLVKRYGPKLGSFASDTGRFSTLEFEYLDYHVTVTVLDGASAREVFTRKDKKPLNVVEQQTLLDANALGSKWEKKDDDQHVTIWVLESRQGFAGYYKDGPDQNANMLVVKTPEMLAFEEALKKMLQQQKQAQTASAPKPTSTPDKSLRP